MYIMEMGRMIKKKFLPNLKIKGKLHNPIKNRYYTTKSKYHT